MSMKETSDDYRWERRDKLDISKNRVIKTTYIKIVRPKMNRRNMFKLIIIGTQYLVSFLANIVTIRNIK
jgi:hypothetical protein